MTALFTGADRSGRWVVPPAVTCVATFGEVVLDFREAILQDRHVVVTLRPVRPGAADRALRRGGRDERKQHLGPSAGRTARRVPMSSDIPVIEVRGYVAASEVLARTPPSHRRWLPGRRKSLS